MSKASLTFRFATFINLPQLGTTSYMSRCRQCAQSVTMGQRRVKLETIDSLIHYSLALYLGLPIVIFAGYFFLGQLGLFGITRQIDAMIIILPTLILGPLSLIAYLIQREKLKFRFIKANVDRDSFKTIVKEISNELRWTIRSHKDDTYTMKTNPGFLNQSWGTTCDLANSERGDFDEQHL
jgi:hypothetical protein